MINFVRPWWAVMAWLLPGGDLAERRFPAPELRRIWAPWLMGGTSS